MDERQIVYLPDNSLKKGYFSVFLEIVNELRWNKWLMYQLFRRDFFAMYKQSFVGVFWAFFMPLLSIATFMVLNRGGILEVGDIGMPYPLYATLGMAFWQVFSTGVTSGANALFNAGPMITRINFSKKALVLASLGRPAIIFLAQIALALVLFLFYKTVPNKGIFLVPLVILPLTLLVFALSFFLSLFNAFAKDVGNGLQVLMTFLMFLTPVLYATPKSGLLGMMTRFNPLYYFISAGRDLMTRGHISEISGFATTCVFSIFFFLISLVFFHLTETRVAERM